MFKEILSDSCWALPATRRGSGAPCSPPVSTARQTLLATSDGIISLKKRGFKCVSMMWRAISGRPYRAARLDGLR